MKPSIYLAGPIRGLGYGEATEWRELAKTAFADLGINAFSPMRAKTYLRAEINVGGDVLADSYSKYPLSTMKAVTTRDRNDCTKSDMVLMYLRGADKVSIGSVIEVGWADAARVPIVLVMEKSGNPHEHGMITEMCSFRVETLAEAIQLVAAVLLP